MRWSSAAGSGWVTAALQGLFFAIWMTVWSILTDHTGWQEALIGAVVGAAFFALIMWAFTRREQEARAALTAGLSGQQRRQVRRAVRTGTPPSDVTLRPVAAAIVRNRLSAEERHRTFILSGLAVFFALELVLVVTDGGAWFLAGALLFGGALIGALLEPRRLRRKLARLEATSDPVPASLGGQDC